ncbi:MAG: response regulator [Planctomycetes bacterium]|nr:response regulator [Planctomycetota bacterium]
MPDPHRGSEGKQEPSRYAPARLILEVDSTQRLLALGGTMPTDAFPLALVVGEALPTTGLLGAGLRSLIVEAAAEAWARGELPEWSVGAERLQGEGDPRVIVRLWPLALEEHQVLIGRSLFAHAPGGIVLLDEKGHHLEQNLAHRKILGFSDEDLASQTPAHYLGARVWSQLQESLLSRGGFRGELSATSSSGETRWLQTVGFSAGLTPARYLLIHRDATFEHIAEEEARLRIDIRRAVQALHAWNRPELNLQEQLQGALSELVLVPWLDLSPHAGVYLREGESDLLRLASAVNLPPELLYLRVEDEQPLVFTAPEETPTDLGDQATLVLPLELGDVKIGALLLFPRTDLDPARRDALAALGATFASLIVRQRVRAALAESEARFRELAASLPGVVYLFEALPDKPTGRFQFVSEAVRDLYGVAPEELLESAAVAIPKVHPADFEGIRESFLRMNETHSDWVHEYRVLHPPGEVRWHRVTSSPRVLDPSRTRWSGVIIDVSEIKRAEGELIDAKEAAEAAARAKSRFLSTVSHELRTPMNAVIGMTDLLRETPLVAGQREFVEAIQSSADTLLLLIEDLINVGRIESERLTLDARPFDVQTSVEESLAQVAPRAAEKNLVLAALVDEGVPERVVGDSVRLHQILVNLLSNAVKFTAAGEVRLRLSALAIPTGWELTFEVKDTGIGIPKDRMHLLFEPFHQIGARDQGGTGLGLAISRGLANLMEGKISAESSFGAGSTFTFTARVGETAAPAELRHSSLSGQTVAVVNPDLASQQMLVQGLQRCGIHVQEPSLTSALAWLAGGGPPESLPALLFLDASTPGAIEAARDREPDLPIVWLLNLGQRSPGTPSSSSLVKPVRTGPLLNLLTSLVGDEPPQAVPSRELALGSRLPLRVLVVEDHRVNLLVATKMLARLGYTPITARDGQEALERLDQEPFDLVLMDVQMPRMDGLEATRQIRTRGRRDPRIVGMTASAAPEDRRRCLAAGMDDYLSKPVRLETLRAMIERAFTTRTPIDSSRIERLKAAGGTRRPDLWRELIQVYLEDTPEMVTQVVTALEAEDRRLASFSAHALKGVALNVGALPLAEACTEIEAMDETNDDASRLVRLLLLESERAETRLTSLLAQEEPAVMSEGSDPS